MAVVAAVVVTLAGAKVILAETSLVVEIAVGMAAVLAVVAVMAVWAQTFAP